MHACTLPDMSVHGAGLHEADLQGVNPFIAGRLFLACAFQLNAQAVRANLITLAALVTRTLVHGRRASGIIEPQRRTGLLYPSPYFFFCAMSK